jgi:hypothetical protein
MSFRRFPAAVVRRRIGACFVVRDHNGQQLVWGRASGFWRQGSNDVVESLIAEAEAGRGKAMFEKGGAAAAVSALTAKVSIGCRSVAEHRRGGLRRISR